MKIHWILFFFFLYSHIGCKQSNRQKNNEFSFQDYVNKFKHIDIKMNGQIPEDYAWGKSVAFNDDRAIKNFYKDKFIVNKIDSVIKIDSSSDLFGIHNFVKNQNTKFFYYGNLEHPNQENIICLIVALQNQDKLYFISTYYQTKTGDFLGFDILAAIFEEAYTKQQINLVSFIKLLPEGLLIEKIRLDRDDKITSKIIVNITEITSIKRIQKSNFKELVQAIDSSSENIQFEQHCGNTRKTNQINYCIQLPKIFIFKKIESQIGISETFEAKDKSAEFIFYTNPQDQIFIMNEGFEKYFTNYKKVILEEGNKVTYTANPKNAYIISGIDKKGYIFYKKLLIKADSQVILASLRYKPAQKDFYSKMIKPMFDSFQ